MDEFLKYRLPYREREVRVGTDSMVLAETFVEESLRREESTRRQKRPDDGLDAFRGAVNAILVSLAFWVALGLVMLTFF